MLIPDDLNELYDQFSDKVYQANKLDKKTKELIAVACALLVDCQPCIEWHYGQAAAAGASKEEIREALAVAMSLAAGSKRAKYGALIDSLEKGEQG